MNNNNQQPPPHAPEATPLPAQPETPAVKPPVRLWARLVTVALAAGTVWWLCFKG